MNENQYLKYLLDNYLQNNLTEDEHQLFFEYIKSGEYDNIISEDIIEKLNSNISPRKTDLYQDDIEYVFKQIINQKTLNNNTNHRFSFKRILIYGTVAAMLTVLGFIFLSEVNKGNKYSKGQIAFESIDSKSLTNHSDSIAELTLPDGSKIDLYPQATIKYPEQFLDTNRVVNLIGSAFFKIAKDTHKPFIVYSNKLKTIVLGTSFFINSNLKNGTEEIEVRSGKVEIRASNLENESRTPIVLKPNQKGVYNERTQLITKTLVSHPKPIIISSNKRVDTGIAKTKFDYDQVSIPTILNDLQLEYGVNIILMNDRLKDDVFTGSLSESDLFNKLKIICLSTQSTYTIDGVNIIIK